MSEIKKGRDVKDEGSEREVRNRDEGARREMSERNEGWV